MSGGVVIAGGGTGGHLFPALAVAGELKRLRPKLPISFVGAGRPLEKRVIEQAGFTARSIKVKPLAGQGLSARLKSLAVLPGAVLSARSLLKELEPRLVLAVGGYAAFPLGLAARLCGLPLAVQDQNAAPGMTNKYLGKLAARVFISFEAARKCFPEGRTELTGNPVRTKLLETAREWAPKRTGANENFNLLILGGSQGARSINRAMAGALEYLDEMKDRIFITHQTGEQDEAGTRAAYAQSCVPHEVTAFIDDMGKAYAKAHLVICRSGAGTVTELCAVGRAAVLVPYPFAAGDHQALNAAAMVETGAGILLPDRQLSGQSLAKLIKDFMRNPEGLAWMEAKALELGRPHAAAEIAGRCLEMMGEAA